MRHAHTLHQHVTVRGHGDPARRQTHRRAALLFRFRFRLPGFPFPSAFSFFSFFAFFSFLCFFAFLAALCLPLSAVTSGPAPAPAAPAPFSSSAFTVDDMCTGAGPCVPGAAQEVKLVCFYTLQQQQQQPPPGKGSALRQKTAFDAGTRRRQEQRTSQRIELRYALLGVLLTGMTSALFSSDLYSMGNPKAIFYWMCVMLVFRYSHINVNHVDA